MRSKSRSPAPNTLTSSSFTLPPSRPPAFLPPSHYAAAAGLSYPALTHDSRDKGSRWRHDSPGSQAVSDPHTSKSPVVRLPDTVQPQSSQIDSPVTTTTPSASHLNRVSRLISRSPSRTASISLRRSGSKNGKHEKSQGQEDNRKSELYDIPLLEMQLIPTLKDTVERMTHPPKPKSSVDGSGEERTQVMSSSRSKASRKLPADNSASVATIYSSPSSARISASTPNPHPNSSASFLPMHQSSTPRLMPTPIVSSTPRVSSSPYYSPRSTPKASSTPKTPLKSALRVNPSSTPAIPEDSSFRATPAKSLRTVKSMVAKTANVPLGAHQEVLVCDGPKEIRL